MYVVYILLGKYVCIMYIHVVCVFMSVSMYNCIFLPLARLSGGRDSVGSRGHDRVCHGRAGRRQEGCGPAVP